MKRPNECPMHLGPLRRPAHCVGRGHCDGAVFAYACGGRGLRQLGHAPPFADFAWSSTKPVAAAAETDPVIRVPSAVPGPAPRLRSPPYLLILDEPAQPLAGAELSGGSTFRRKSCAGYYIDSAYDSIDRSPAQHMR